MGKPTPCQWNTPLRCQGAAAWRTPVHPRVCVNGGTELDHRCGLVWRAFRGGPRCWQDLSPLTIAVEKRPAVSAFAESRPVEPTLPRLRGVISWSLVRCRGPCPVGFWGVANSIEHCCNFGDELVAQSRASLVVPKCGAANLGTRLRMQFEAHVAVRVPSGSGSARSPSWWSELDLQRPLANAAPTRSPMPWRLHRPTPPDWKAVPPRHERGQRE